MSPSERRERQRRALMAVPVVIAVAFGIDALESLLPVWLWWAVGITTTLLMLVGFLLWVEQPWRPRLNTASEKLKAQADPEGQEYAYRTVWARRSNGEITRSRELVSQESASKVAAGLTDGHFEAWVERALLGTWERVEQ